jgi:hypothetical protein
MTSHVLRFEKGIGHGLLIVLDCILRNFQRERSVLSFSTFSIPDDGPILCWLLYRLVADHPLISLSYLLKEFGGTLLSQNPRTAAFAVNLSHILKAAAGRKAFLKASEYVMLMKLSQRRETVKDNHIRDVISPLFFRIVVSDMENYPAVLIANFPECPAFVQSIFLNAARRSAKFLKGWVEECRGKRKKWALRYLEVLAGRLPLVILRAFPKVTEPLLEYESNQIEMIEKKLERVSDRFVRIVVVILILWGFAVLVG